MNSFYHHNIFGTNKYLSIYLPTFTYMNQNTFHHNIGTSRKFKSKISLKNFMDFVHIFQFDLIKHITPLVFCVYSVFGITVLDPRTTPLRFRDETIFLEF